MFFALHISLCLAWNKKKRHKKFKIPPPFCGAYLHWIREIANLFIFAFFLACFCGLWIKRLTLFDSFVCFDATCWNYYFFYCDKKEKCLEGKNIIKQTWFVIQFDKKRRMVRYATYTIFSFLFFSPIWLLYD